MITHDAGIARTAHKGVSRDFALQVSLAHLKNQRFQKIDYITFSIAHIGAGRIAGFDFPLSPVDEQFEIVRVVEERLTAIKQCEKILESEPSPIKPTVADDP
ncbi:hypothetical protein Mal15_64230 [Stieleria maiorica]|uniref:Type I restriction modification DNA specificity domain-containing protein n=1 Tax=Stieleria maiorica TaxID=2795974 RepID=A0A5B9MRB8_9BACT|nr:hypothetical protein [Stieleria maiorica]QEG02336.1 hypothetical protein Mal15_64230 [Stieleria maiorica]